MVQRIFGTCTPSMVRSALLLITTLMYVGCGEDEEPVDPTGTWELEFAYGDGTCGLTGTTVTTWGVSKSSGGWTFNIPNGGTLTGQVECTVDACEVSLALARSGNDPQLGAFTETATYNITLSDDDSISGDGLYRLTLSSGTCDQQFELTGERT